MRRIVFGILAIVLPACAAQPGVSAREQARACDPLYRFAGAPADCSTSLPRGYLTTDESPIPEPEELRRKEREIQGVVRGIPQP